MAVSEDKRTAVVDWYRVLSHINMPYTRVRLCGLDPELCYEERGSGKSYFGDELMNIGPITTDGMSGQVEENKDGYGDFDSRLYVFKARQEEQTAE